MTRLSLVVAGVPQLADALAATSRFEKVYPINTTGGLRDLIAGGLLAGATKESLLFFFADNLTVDTPSTPLSKLLRGLTGRNFRVIVVERTPGARALVKEYPQAGLLPGRLTVNQALAAIAGLGVPGIDPVEDGFDVIDLDGEVATTPAAAVSFPAPTAATPAPAAAPTPAAKPVAPAAVGSWTSASASFAAEVPAATAVADRKPGPAAMPGWTTPAVTAASELEATPETEAAARAAAGPSRRLVAPAATASAGAAPFGTPAALSLNDWDTPPVKSEWSTPAPVVAPFGAPFGTDSPAPRAAFGAPAAVPLGGGWAAPAGEPVLPDAVETGALTQRRLVAPAEHPLTQRRLVAPGGTPASRASLAPRGGYTEDTGGRRGRVIAISVPKGGAGKTSLTLNLAVRAGLRLRPEKKRVCVIDANFQQADTGKYLNEYSPNIAHIVRDNASLAGEDIERYMKHRHDLSLSLMLGPAMPSEASPAFMNAKLYCRVLDAIRPLYDYIFIDTPVAEYFHDIFSAFVLPNADYLAVPVQPNVATLMNTYNWLDLITQSKHANGAGFDEDKIGVLLNRAKDHVDCSEDDVRAEMHRWKFIGTIPDNDDWMRCNNNHELVATKNYPDLSRAFDKILFYATGESVFAEAQHAVAEKAPSGLTSMLPRFLRKKGRP